MDNGTRSFGERFGRWMPVFLSTVALLTVLLGVSWLYGWPPFFSQVTIAPEKTGQEVPAEQSVLDSLTAPAASPTENVAPILKQLTPTLSGSTKKNGQSPDTSAILESLTPKQ